MRRNLTYPGGKRFAFSIFDDTDAATLHSIRPLYDYLYELGILTTKSVWGVDYTGKSDYHGSHTLENSDYANYVRELHRRGFEIGWHGASLESATRAETQRGLGNFERVVGAPPMIYAAHGRNRDNLYWGVDRFAFKGTQWLYMLFKGERGGYFQGHNPDSKFFWGDLAGKHVNYVRSFTFAETNLLNLRLPLVYRRPDTPYVKSWFITCAADNVEEFNAVISNTSQRGLEAQGGLCLISTHFGKGFVVDGKIHTVTRELLKKLAERDGWFVPVSNILDLYVKQQGCPEPSRLELLSMELKWFTHVLKRRLQF